MSWAAGSRVKVPVTPQMKAAIDDAECMDLASDDFHTRRAAAAADEIGYPCFCALQDAAKSTDAEVRFGPGSSQHRAMSRVLFTCGI